MSGYPSGPPYGRGAHRRRSGPRKAVGLIAALVLTLVIGLQLVGRLGVGPDTAELLAGGTATSTATTSTSTPGGWPSPAYPPPTAGAPSATPQPKRRPAPPNRSLTRNSLYAVNLDRTRVSCGMRVREPKPPLRDADLAAYLRSVVKCLVKVHRTPLAARGFTVTEPKIKVYRSTVKAPCGQFDQKGAPAYYCSADSTIYWPATRDDGREAYTYARLGYAALLAHEFGHHLQAVTGIVNAYAPRYAAADSRSERYLLSRRLELQAQCFEGVFLSTVARPIKLSAKDRDELRAWHGFTGDEDPPKSRKPDHGTSKAQIRWLVRGLDSQDFGRCNTWTAPKSAVK